MQFQDNFFFTLDIPHLESDAIIPRSNISGYIYLYIFIHLYIIYMHMYIYIYVCVFNCIDNDIT